MSVEHHTGESVIDYIHTPFFLLFLSLFFFFFFIHHYWACSQLLDIKGITDFFPLK